MKFPIILTIFTAFCLFGFQGKGQSEQEKLDLPGDNLNLYSVLKLFQESETLEGFEKKLNEESSKVNNLDLNGDDKIDYIKVVDKQEGEVHNITLKVDVSKEEEQDVAVFVVKKEKDGGVQIQVIGDEDLYGKDYIIEPNIKSGDDGSALTPNPGYTGNRNSGEVQEQVQYTTPNEISTWPVVSYIYEPSYVSWYSPWDWNYYPSYWRPWRPFYWHYYYGYHYQWNYFYNSHYRRWQYYRLPGWRDRYYQSGFRSRSAFVQARYNRGDFNRTYTRPGLAKKGANEFKRDNPMAPTVNNKLPSFDETGRPVVKRPETKRPVTRPVAAEPVTTNPPVTRPVPSTPDETNPATRPVTARPGKKEQVTNNPTITKPVPTERKPEPRPVPTSPRTEPVITRAPERKQQPPNRPTIRTEIPRAPAPRPTPARPPATRPPNNKLN